MNVALIGNPNCGKTTLFNRLTGNNQHVGNWPGVTVEKKTGKCEKYNVLLTDLPGIYSLSPYSAEERISREFLLKDSPDKIICLLDATTLERSLYLALQVLELGLPTVIAVNMADVLARQGDSIDYQGISDFLGVSVIPISAKKKENLDLLMETLLEADIPKRKVTYDHITRKYLWLIRKKLCDHPFPDFYAPKLLESDPEYLREFSKQEAEQFESISTHYEKETPLHDRVLGIAESRYRIAEHLAHTFLSKSHHVSPGIAEAIDAVALNRFVSLPCFSLLLFLMFYATFSDVSALLQHKIETLWADLITAPFLQYAVATHMPEWIKSLIMDGVFAGVSSVLSFLPPILILFFCLSLLEDSGYMARAAFIMDGLLQKIGLSGKAFIPMLMGFGCTTPAVMATRTIEKETDRRVTVLLTPFLSCSAKLPIYTLFIGSFFIQYRSMLLFFLYLLGLFTAVLCGWLLKRTVLKGEKTPFALELPPYRMPGLGNIAPLMWDKIKSFLKRAGTVIFAMSVVTWVMGNVNFAFQLTQDPTNSMLGKLGHYLSPIFLPLGFGQKEAVIALISGLVAKESVVSCLTVLYHGMPQKGILANFTPASALSFMVFCLLYVPCISAFATMAKELNSRRWALLSFCLQMTAAYLISLTVYRISLVFLG